MGPQGERGFPGHKGERGQTGQNGAKGDRVSNTEFFLELNMNCEYEFQKVFHTYTGHIYNSCLTYEVIFTLYVNVRQPLETTKFYTSGRF